MFLHFLKFDTPEGCIESHIKYDERSNSYVYQIINLTKKTSEQKSYGNGVDCLKARDDRLLELLGK